MTSIDIPDVIRNMPTFAPANDLLTAPEQILQRIDEVGYVFLQGVLDTEAVARLHQKFLDYLKSMGVVAPDARRPVPGASPRRFLQQGHRLPDLLGAPHGDRGEPGRSRRSGRNERLRQSARP